MELWCQKLDQTFKLQEGTYLLGRSKEDCDIVLPPNATEVSRKHAECTLDASGKLHVRDLKSRNGTELGNVSLPPMEWQRAHHNDEIHIGNYAFLVRDEGSIHFIETNEDDDQSSILMSSGGVFGQPEQVHYGQLQALIRVSDVLRGILHSQQVLHEAAKILHEIFSSIERAVIGTVDDLGRPSPGWWYSRNDEREMRISSTIIKRVIDTGQALLSPNAMDDFNGTDSLPLLATKAVMCAPLFGEQDQTIGFVYVDASRQNVFCEADLKILAAIATQVSLALGYSRMHESVVQTRVLQEDLKRAREAQAQYLPSDTPNLPGYEISFFYRAARQIGGDYLDSIPLQDSKHLFVLGDVEGKGAPAALTMVRLASETQAGAEICQSPSALLNRLGQRMTEKWITYVAVQLDWKEHAVRIANAAQELPLHVAWDGKYTELTSDTGGFAFSVFPEEEYSETEIKLEEGDTLILYSDGFPDAESEAGERFGKQRLFDCIQNNDAESQDLATTLCTSIDEFRGSVEQFDDMCMICIKRTC